MAGGGVEFAEVGDIESGEEVFLHVADAGLDAISCPAPTLHGADEAVMAGELGERGLNTGGCPIERCSTADLDCRR